MIASQNDVLEPLSVLQALPAQTSLWAAAPVVAYVLRRSVTEGHAQLVACNLSKMRHMQMCLELANLRCRHILVTSSSVCARTGKGIGLKPFMLLPDLSTVSYHLLAGGGVERGQVEESFDPGQVEESFDPKKIKQQNSTPQIGRGQ